MATATTATTTLYATGAEPFPEPDTMSRPERSLLGLSDLLDVSVVQQRLTPYLPARSLVALLATSKHIRRTLLESPSFFNYLDLSSVKSAVLPEDPIDPGGINWRSQRMDEALTEDDFYSGPIRGVFSKIERLGLLKNIRTLVLDGLSVPADVVNEIITSKRFDVRILSIRGCRHLNENKLVQTLRYAVRPSRPEGTPGLQGLYFFGKVDLAERSMERWIEDRLFRSISHVPQKDGITLRERAELAELQAQITLRERVELAQFRVQMSHPGSLFSEMEYNTCAGLREHSESSWYGGNGPKRAIELRSHSPDWPQVLKECEGIIHFDTVLCRGPRHDMIPSKPVNHNLPVAPPAEPLKPALANQALGPAGCASCGSIPEGAAIHGDAPDSRFPLLSPPLLHSFTIQSAQKPGRLEEHKGKTMPLFTRCNDCMAKRMCKRCGKWWCEDCYSAKRRMPEVRLHTEAQLPEWNSPSDQVLELLTKLNLAKDSETGEVSCRTCCSGSVGPASQT